MGGIEEIAGEETHKRYDGQVFAEEGERADSLYVWFQDELRGPGFTIQGMSSKALHGATISQGT